MKCFGGSVVIRSLSRRAALKLGWKFYLPRLSDDLGPFRKFASAMSERTVAADVSGHMLDLDEDEDLEVFSKVKQSSTKTNESKASVSSKRIHWPPLPPRDVDLIVSLTKPLEPQLVEENAVCPFGSVCAHVAEEGSRRVRVS